MTKEQRFWLLTSLKLNGEATPAEVSELEALIASDVDFSKKYASMQLMYRSRGVVSEDQNEALYNRHLQRLSNFLSEPSLRFEQSGAESNIPAQVSIASIKAKKQTVLKYLAIAACLAGCVLFGIEYFVNSGSDNLNGNTVNTSPGSKSKILLPDGTSVWLNADSKLTYNDDFNDTKREVYLVGEAYFDVAKNKEKPFIIHTPVIDLKVLGTAFNVRSYDNDKETETVLVHGSVEVLFKSSGNDKKIVLKPGEKLIVKNDILNKDAKESPARQNIEAEPLMLLTRMNYHGKDSAKIEDFWTEKRLYFENETLVDLAIEIERWYNVRVIIKDPSLLNVRFTGAFQNETLEEVMRSLKLTGSFTYEINGREVLIGP